MNKTAEMILHEVFTDVHNTWLENNENIVPEIIQAMHTYANQVSEDRAMRFVEWLTGSTTTKEMYQLFLSQENQQG